MLVEELNVQYDTNAVYDAHANEEKLKEKLEGKSLLGRYKCRWEANIKIDLKDTR